MRSANSLRALAMGMTLVLLATAAHAQTTVYRWTDDQGVVHMGDYPPEHGNYEVVNMVTPTMPATRAPADRPVVSPTRTSPPAREPGARERQPAAQRPAPAVDVAAMSLEELDRRCEEAREQRIAPLREAEIARCKANRRNDPAWCERFNADFGDGGRTVGGTIRPRMFDDLPECAEALNERNRRPR